MCPHIMAGYADFFIFNRCFYFLNNLKKHSWLKNSICTVGVVVECVWERKIGCSTAQLVCRFQGEVGRGRGWGKKAESSRHGMTLINEEVPIRRRTHLLSEWAGWADVLPPLSNSFLSTWWGVLLCNLVAPHTNSYDTPQHTQFEVYARPLPWIVLLPRMVSSMPACLTPSPPSSLASDVSFSVSPTVSTAFINS